MEVIGFIIIALILASIADNTKSINKKFKDKL